MRERERDRERGGEGCVNGGDVCVYMCVRESWWMREEGQMGINKVIIDDVIIFS